MEGRAQTPEELETLFEDISILRDSSALTDLFSAEAVLGMPGEPREARGADEVVRRIDRLWRTGHTHVADVRRVLQSGPIALVAARGVNVMRRCPDGIWRYVICMPLIEERPNKENDNDQY